MLPEAAEQRQALLNFLWPYVTEERQYKLLQVLDHRTRYLSLAVEDLFKEQNASAIVRTADLMGVQDVHIIEKYHRYRIQKGISSGSHKWLSTHVYNDPAGMSTPKCIKALKTAGYRIVATSPHKDAYTPDNFPIEGGKFALIFGSEKTGLSEEAFEAADELIRLPMVGFTESYNVSIAAALLSDHLIRRIKASDSIHWRLSDEERRDILIDWSLKSVRRPDALVRYFLNDIDK
ncbi:MAG: RNA methyltransferase [Cyclobacteriaceae bacterium]|nr:RNA methyltransferase [Cyclobacteriaceae bacterium]